MERRYRVRGERIGFAVAPCWVAVILGIRRIAVQSDCALGLESMETAVHGQATVTSSFLCK